VIDVMRRVIAMTTRLIFASMALGLALALPAAAQNGPIDITSQGAAAKKAPAKVKADPKVTVAATPAGPLSAGDIVKRANGYFNGMSSFTGDFVQTGEDGRRYKGKLMVERPGKMRFDYDPPAKVLILSDGTTVAIVDERLKTKDRYPLGQTPLKFLVQDRVDLGRDLKLIRAKADEQTASVLVEDKTTFGGTSRVNLLFDRATFNLKGWTVTDAQGTKTTVQVANITTGKNLSEKLFKIGNEDLLFKQQSSD
jgi:outer membrane lipoprotein-sorting protein